MKFKTISVFLSAIALVAVPLMLRGQAEETYDCLDPLEAIELSDDQNAQLWQLEEDLYEKMDEILPISSDSEAKIVQLEENFEAQIEALLSPQQQQQIEQLDIWAEEQIVAISPELFEETEDDLVLTPAQETALDAIDAEYEQRFEDILTAEQQQQIEVLETQLDEAIDAELPEPTAEQEARLDAAEAEFEAGMMQLLTPEQRQQLQNDNRICDDADL